MIKGKIIKGIGGFYYVEAAEAVYECKARGNFRNKSITPLVGDDVEISLGVKGDNRIETILPRRNSLIRPPLANLDTLFIVSSLRDPDINLFNIDKMTVIAEHNSIEPVIVLTKTDLGGGSSEYADIYKKAGFTVIECNNLSGEGSQLVRELLRGKTSAFSGNTGVGKSSLLNAIDPSLELKTGETSKKLGRGRHTTRHCQLYRVAGGYVADTPGFSSFELDKTETVLKDELFDCFREFAPYFGKCRFTSCSHTGEKGCAVCEAVARGEISESRHKSYVRLYNSAKNINEWEL